MWHLCEVENVQINDLFLECFWVVLSGKQSKLEIYSKTRSYDEYKSIHGLEFKFTACKEVIFVYILFSLYLQFNTSKITKFKLSQSYPNIWEHDFI